MPKVSPIQNSFESGELSPLMHGRTDFGRYKQGLETCLNYIPTLQGGLVRRSGTKYVADVKTSSKATRLIPFEFSTTQAYIIEMGDLYLRFYKDNAQIGAPYEIVSPFAEADLFEVKIAQSADLMYLVHPDYPTQVLTRTSDTSWTIADMVFEDGPYMDLNDTSTVMTPSAATGTGVTLTASAVTGINDDTGFQTTDVGRFIRLQEGSVWGYVEITARSSTTVVTVTVHNTLTDTSSKGSWKMGLYSETTGYPSSVTFHENRLSFAGAPSSSQRVDMSNTGDYANFAPSGTDSTIVASNAISFTFNANDVNAIRWQVSDEKGLAIGTVGGEWMVRPSSNSEALTPSNITAKRSTTYGSANIAALQVGKSGLFVQRSGRKIREFTYYFEAGGFRAPDLTILAEHVTETGIVEMAMQKEPQPILWCVKNNGILSAMTYERGSEDFKAGWHRHQIGGVSDAGGTAAKVESVATIPSADGSTDDVWVLVQRYVDGAVVRQIEYITPMFNDTIEQKDAFFIDSGLTYDAPVTVSGATSADPCVITATSHGFSDGDKVLFSDVLGMSELNGNSYLVANKTTHTFEITDLVGVDIDATAFTAYVSGGEVRKYVSTISGLDHLEGEVISILADGAAHPDRTVSSGAVTLAVPATTVHAGLSYVSDIKTLRLDAGAADGTAIGKTRRIHRLGIMMHRSLGLKIGLSFDALDELTFRTYADKMSRAPALFTGIRTETLEADYDLDNEICIRQDQPLPSIILAIMPQMITQDR